MTPLTPLTPDQFPGLPKWPGVYVTGTRVTPEQAKEIIMRTDSSVTYPGEFSISGNNREFTKRVSQAFGFTAISDLGWDERAHKVRELWVQKMGIVATEYVYNSYLSSSYFGGPTGWVHLDGSISVNGHNYGKWPDVETIVADWQKLAAAFPYLDLQCTLFSHEACEEEAQPVVTIVVKDQQVTVYPGDLTLHTKVFQPAEEDLVGQMKQLLSNPSFENAWPAHWVDEFAARSQQALSEALEETKDLSS